MLTDPSIPLQAAIVALLKGDPEIVELVGDRIFDRIPNVPTFPYISFGDTQVLPQNSECTDAANTFVTLHTWERFKGFDNVKGLGKIVIAALHDQELSLIEGRTQSVLLESARYVRDPDGLTSHGILTFEILTDSNQQEGILP